MIAPPAGDCKDYAITKRHELLARGWPSRALLLSEVVVPSGEHHLVLVVRLKDVDLVLDNLNANIRPVNMMYHQYQWVRIEMPQNPMFWARVRVPGAMRTAMLSGQRAGRHTSRTGQGSARRHACSRATRLDVSQSKSRNCQSCSCTKLLVHKGRA